MKREKSLDIYFEPSFSSLYEEIEGGKSETFECICEYGHVVHSFIKRAVPEKVNGIQYFDAITSYGYGGPIIVALSEDTDECKKRLIESFCEMYSRFCKQEKIVSEFVRFHPLYNNASDFSSAFNVEVLRNTVGTDLKKYPEFLIQEYSKGCRKNIKQALAKGVEIEVIEAPDNLVEFKGVYYSTMDRNNASEYYYFDDSYFSKCLEKYRNHILLVNARYEDRVIASGFYFIWNEVLHIHLSGTLSEYLHLSPAYLLRYGATKWASEHGYKLVFHGGGKSNDENDSLYKFKKQFGKNTTFPFAVGKKIWNKEIYDYLSRNVKEETDFFPLYRKR